MANVGDVVATLKANPAGWVTGFNQAASAAQGLVNATTTVSTAIGVTLGNALTQALTKLGDFISSTLEMGRQARIMEAAFKAMATTVGQSADDIARKVSAASGELIDLTSAYSSMGRLLTQGLDVSALEDLAEVAKGVSVVMGTDVTTAFNRMSEAVLSGNTRMLRQVGIYIDSEKALAKYAASLGTSVGALTEAGRSQAIYEEIMRKTAGTVNALTQTMDPSIKAAKELEVQWKNLKEEVGKTADTIRTDFIKVIVEAWPQLRALVLGLVEAFMSLTRTTVEAAKAIAPFATSLAKIITDVLAAFNALPDIIKSSGIIGVILFGRLAPSAMAAAMKAAGPWVTVAMAIAVAYKTIDAGIRASVTDTQRLNDLLAEQAALTNRINKLKEQDPGANLSALEAELANITAQINAIKTLQGGIEDPFTFRKEPPTFSDAGPTQAKTHPDLAAMEKAARSVAVINHDFAMSGQMLGDVQQKYVDLHQTWEDLSKVAPDPENQKAYTDQIRQLAEATKTAADEVTARTRQLDSEIAAVMGSMEGDARVMAGILTPVHLGIDTTELAVNNLGEAVTSTLSHIDSMSTAFSVGGISAQAFSAGLATDIAALEKYRTEGGLTTEQSNQLAAAQKKLADVNATLDARFIDSTDAQIEYAAVMGNSTKAIEDANKHLTELDRLFASGDMSPEAYIQGMNNIIEALRKVSTMMAEVGINTDEINKKIQDLASNGIEKAIAAWNKYADDLEKINTAQVRMQEAYLRAQLELAEQSGDVWRGIAIVAQQELLKIPSFFDQVMAAARTVFQELGRAFSDSFTAIMKGDLDDLDDIWKTFLDSLIRMFSNFLADAAVQGLVGLAGSLFGLSGINIQMPSITGGGSSPVSSAAGAVGVTGMTGGPMGVTLGPVGVTTQGVTVFGSQVYSFGTSATQLAGPGSASYASVSASAAAAQTAGIAAGVAAAEAAAGGIGGAGGFLAAESAATMATSSASVSSMAPALAAIAPYAAIAAPLIPFVYGLMTSPSSSEKKDVQFANTVTEIAEFQNELIAGTLEPEQLLSAVAAQQKFTTDFSGMGELPYLPDVTEITDPATIDRLEKFYGENAALVAESLLTNVVMIEEAFRQETAAIISGEQVVETTPMWTSTGSGDNGTQPVDMSGAYSVQASQILAGIPGIEAMDPAAMQSFTNLMASFGENEAAMVELIQSISEQLPEGMRLTTEQAAALVEQGKLATEQYNEINALVADLSMKLLDTTNGVGNMAQEALEFVNFLASGVVPAESLTGLFQALSTEHGPGFTEALMAAVEQLGLSNEEAAALLESIALMAEGVTVPVEYEISVSGEPPPGVESPVSVGTGSGDNAQGGGGGGFVPTGSGAGVPDVGKFYGGWAGAPGYAPGGWVRGGVTSRDSVPAWLARDEFVINNKVARMHGASLEALNRTGSWPGDSAAIGALLSAGAEDREMMREDREMMREQNKLLKDIVRALTRGGGGRLAGSVV